MNKILFALIAVLAFASCNSPTGTASAPVATANAGADQTTNVFDTVNLVGSGNASSYSWAIVDPDGATVGTASVASTSFAPSKMGTYVATLTSTLGGTTATDTVNVVVSSLLVGTGWDRQGITPGFNGATMFYQLNSGGVVERTLKSGVIQAGTWSYSSSTVLHFEFSQVAIPLEMIYDATAKTITDPNGVVYAIY